MTEKQDRISINVRGQNREVFMSFGLLNELGKVVGSAEYIPHMSLDPHMREEVLKTLLSTRDENGQITEAWNPFRHGLGPDDTIRLLSWASEHVTDFFMKALETAKAIQDKTMPRLKALMPSSDGMAT